MSLVSRSMRALAPGLVAASLLAAPPSTAAPDPSAPADLAEGARLLERGSTDAALPLLEAAARAAPADLFARANLAGARLAAGRADAAAVIYRDLLASAPGPALPALWLGLGEALRRLGEAGPCREALERAATLAPPGSPVARLARERIAALPSP